MLRAACPTGVAAIWVRFFPDQKSPKCRGPGLIGRAFSFLSELGIRVEVTATAYFCLVFSP
jgi:hypothetical protein